MKYKLAIFDFDGTLADSLPWFLESVNHAADLFRFRRLEPAQLESFRDRSTAEILANLALPLWKLPLIVRHMRQQMGRDIARISLFPGADEMLQDLSNHGVILTVVSSNSAENVRAVLGPRNMRLIRHLGCGASMFGKRSKFKAVLRKSGVPPQRAICIGDEQRDLDAARAEGIAFGAVAWGYARIQSLQAASPEEVFMRIEEIAEKLNAPEQI